MKKVFITGADRGIGHALTKEFLSQGYLVYAGQYMPEWKELDELKLQYPETLFTVPLDVGSTDSVKAAYELVKKQTDYLDILVNVAGILGNIRKITFEQMFDVNTVGVIRMVDIFLPLLHSDSTICFFSSEAGSVALSERSDMEEWLGYCSSKAMLNMAIRLMFNKLNPQNYKFRVYHPGGVNGYLSGEKGTTGEYEPEDSAKKAFLQFTSKRSWEDVLILTDIEDNTWAF